ncbi:TolC family protein [Nibrella viscosa]|uniref:TolC family protein n=1 Tax=Nibrella viscosa TaxID=1084524 RepID=A0ABP8KSE8_9BACT
MTNLCTAEPDTSVLTARSFYEVVAQNHPLVRQAALFNDEARQEVLQAQGAFDPKLFGNYYRKDFGNKLYYDKWLSGLSVPVWLGGADIKVTHERNRGSFVNAEDRLATPGMTAIGLNVPVGQGFLIDARRNALRQAELAVTLADADRLKLINKTLFDAAKTYWDWYVAYQQYTLIQEGYQLADVRYRAVRQRALLGDAAPIDTTEALITAQDRLVQRQQAEVELQNARLRMSAFLWNGNNQAVDLPSNVTPQAGGFALANEEVLQSLLNRAAEQHPDLTKLDTKVRQLILEERFRREMLKPQINLNASLLSGTALIGGPNDWPTYYSFRPANHKIGVDLMFPLFLRKERGKLRQVQIKAQQVNLERQQTSRFILNAVQGAYNELKALENQIAVQQQAVTNQRILLRAEQQKFEIGESSLFLVNAREAKLIDMAVKLEQLRAKYQKAIAELYFTAGTNTPI